MFQSDIAHHNQRLGNKLAQLYALARDKKIDLSFRPPYLELLRKLGDPHRRLPPVVHVAGTNGKGSTIAYLKAIFEAAGYRVHAYTSPHLIKMNERIYVAGQDISDEALEDLIDETLALNDGADITFFEITTAMALAAFTRTHADVLLLEVGLGGRLDCTNIVPNPALCVITQIGMDHMEHLGNTLPQIAFEKAGIMKQGAPCIIGPQSDEAKRAHIQTIFEDTARLNRVPLLQEGAQWRMHVQQDALWLESSEANGLRYVFPQPALAGLHQCENAATAAMAAITLRKIFDLSDDAIMHGLQNARWPARLQSITDFFEDPGDCDIYLDGGHNEAASHALARQAAAWAAQDGRPLHVVLGMMGHKDPASFVAPLAPWTASLTLVKIPGESESHDAGALIHKLAVMLRGRPVSQAISPQDAVGTIVAAAPQSRILITGSLYLAGAVLKWSHDKAHNMSQK